MFIENNNKKMAFKTCKVCSAAPPLASRALMLTQTDTPTDTLAPTRPQDGSASRLLVNVQNELVSLRWKHYIPSKTEDATMTSSELTPC